MFFAITVFSHVAGSIRPFFSAFPILFSSQRVPINHPPSCQHISIHHYDSRFPIHAACHQASCPHKHHHQSGLAAHVR
jgi:hypothetical protein